MALSAAGSLPYIANSTFRRIVRMTRQRNTARAQFSSDLTVREFWELGHAGINNWKRRNRLADLETRPSKDENLEKLAKQKGMKYKFLSIAMRVATTCDETEINEYEKLIGTVKSRFGTSHLSRLVSIQNAKKRRRLGRRAIEGGWSFRELDGTIRTIRGGRSNRGRKPREPRDDSAAVGEFLKLTSRWVKWYELYATKLPRGLKDPAAKMYPDLLVMRNASTQWSGRRKSSLK